MNTLFTAGHTACAGCGQSMAARLVIDSAGANTIIVNNTGCLEVFSTGYPISSWKVPFIHSLFENAGAVSSGVEAALKHLGKKDGINIIAQAGDGGTADIGLQSLSGMWERGHDILSICYDNEAYMNTGIQRSGLTPLDSNTTTSPVGKESLGNPRPKKNIPAIALAHGCVYVATATVGYPRDLQAKVKKAFTVKGPKYLHILVPCPLGWRYDPALTYKIGKLAVDTALFPLIEYVNGKLTGVKKSSSFEPVENYLKPQARFKHLFANTEEARQQLNKIQKIADSNIEYFGLKETVEEK